MIQRIHSRLAKKEINAHEKRYCEKYLATGLPITLIGAAFDPQTRNLEQWLTEDTPSTPG
ncbi:MAG: hypothetical protein PHV34_16130 [Verrucomicrobiae bacterium]|nr:hypothetical protein [Verrucomicrobiae bacterium]